MLPDPSRGGIPVKLAHTHPFNGPLSGTTRVSQYQKGKTNLDFTEARDTEWQWHQLGHMQVCTSLQTDNHARQASTEIKNRIKGALRPGAGTGHWTGEAFLPLTDHGTVARRHHFLGSRRQLDASPPSLEVVRDDRRVVAGRACQPAAVPGLLLQVTDHRAFWHHADRQHVPHLQRC